ncbi:MAG: MerR family transcriptional regulator [Vicinamibacterales bacterium]
MAETPGGIPNKAWFKASEVCELAGVQPYVLRSWESEFPSLGVARGEGKPRVYRREDVELVLRIKRLVVGEGLTLAGVRRRMEGEIAPDPEAVPLSEVLGPEVVQRVSEVRQGLRSLLEMLTPPVRPAEGKGGHAGRSTGEVTGSASGVPRATAAQAGEAGSSGVGGAVVRSANEALPLGPAEDPPDPSQQQSPAGTLEDTKRRASRRNVRRSSARPA